MASLLASLKAIDLGKLSIHLDAASGTVGGSASLTGLDPHDLLGEFGALFKDLSKDLPASPNAVLQLVSAELRPIEALFPAALPASMGNVAGDLAALLALVQKLSDLMSGDAGPALVEKLIRDLGGFDKIVGDLLGRVTEAFPLELPPIAKIPVDVIGSLATGLPADGAALADLLGRLVLGLDLATLRAPALEIERIGADLALATGDLEPIRAGFAELTVKVKSVTASLTVPAPDVSASLALLAEIQTGMDALAAARHDTLARLVAGLAAIDLPGLAARIDAAVAPLARSIPRVEVDYERAIVAPVRGIAAGLAVLDAGALEARLADAEKTIREAVESSEMGDLLAQIDGVFDRLVTLLRRVPILRARDEVVDALTVLEARIRTFPGFTAPHAFVTKLHALASAVEQVGTTQIQDRVKAVRGAIDAAVSKFPMKQVRAELDDVLGKVLPVMKDFTTGMEALAKSFDEMAEALGAIDLEAAGQVSIGKFEAIRKAVKSITAVTGVPEPARSAIQAASAQVKSFDIRASVSAPITEVLDGLDPEAILAPIGPGIQAVRDVLAKVTPQALIDALEPPFEAILAALSKFKPEALVAGLSASFEDLVGRLQALDPRPLVAPLQAQFEALVTKLQTTLDPSPLFAPLRDAYGKLDALLAQLDFTKLFQALASKIASLPSLFGDGLKGALAGKVGAAPELPSIEGEPFRLGDLLRPFALLVGQVRERVAGLAAGVLGDGLALLLAPLVVLRRLADPAVGFFGQLASTIEDALALLDPAAARGPALALTTALQALTAAAATAALSAEASAQIGGAVASVQIGVRMAPAPGAAAAVDTQIARLHGGFATAPAVAAVRSVGRDLARLLPASLLDLDPHAAAAAAIDALFAGIDPSRFVDELDALGEQMKARLATFAKELTRGLFALLDSVLGAFSPLMPAGIIGRLGAGLDRLKNELRTLDPGPIEAEVKALVTAVADGLRAYSPASFAAALASVLDAVRAQLAALDPAKLLGDLNPIQEVIASFEALRPSAALGPLVAQTKDLEHALDDLASLKFVEPMKKATARLGASIDVVLPNVQLELEGLLDDLGSSGGGSIHAEVTVHASAST